MIPALWGKMMPSILLVEDNETLTKMFLHYFRKKTNLQVSATFGSAEEALQWFQEQEAPTEMVDVVLVDLSLPGMNGITLVEELRAAYPGIKCLILSGHKNKLHVRRALEAGARGYVLKDDLTQLPMGVERAMAGEIFLSDTLAP
jgi:DNA-binding NarL/FixJ family response regulator